ncbi:MAG: hypothetical protein KGL31_04315 [candidate division NC10 bacterium]|nr:hypothetical protein [candidate division NC10 bacterium]
MWREWADEVETWFQFLKDREGWDRYLPRLRDDARTRDETLSEIAVTYFLKTRCGLQVLEWEPLGRKPKRGEFLVGHDSGPNIFIEVKSPGWEAEIIREVAKDLTRETGVPELPLRLKRPKYLAGDGGCTDPVTDVRKAVDKAYPKLPDSIPTMLIVADDLRVALNSWPEVVRIALYCRRAQGYATGYLAEDGCFASQRYEHLGAVGVFNVQLKGSTFEYRFCVFHNPNCLPAAAIPKTVFADYQQCDGF